VNKMRIHRFITFPAILLTGWIQGWAAPPEETVMRETKTVKIALSQIFALDGDREGNFVRIENALKEAKAQGAEIACFPETTIYGWVNPDAHQRAHPIPGEDSDRMCGLARKYSIYICAGLAEKEHGHLYDSAILIDKEGRILLKHRKINLLTQLMNPPYTPGEDIQAVETPWGRIGILICADTFVKENLQRMAALEPDLVLVPYGWAADETEWPQHGNELHKTVAQAARAIGAPVIGTDLVGEITRGPWAGKVYGGQSVAADAQGHILAIAKDRDRDILVVSIQPGRVRP